MSVGAHGVGPGPERVRPGESAVCGQHTIDLRGKERTSASTTDTAAPSGTALAALRTCGGSSGVSDSRDRLTGKVEGYGVYSCAP